MKFAASALAAFAGLACASPVTTTALGARALTLGEILAPILKFLDCNIASPEIKLLCEAVADKVNLELKQAGITISSGGLLFQYFDDDDIDIDTGHSCTITAKVLSTEASARIDQSASIDLSGNPLSGAALLAIKLPVELSAKAHVKQRFGQRVLGSCVNLGSDSFDVSGRLSTTAKVAVFFAIAPSLRTDVNGDYVLTIKPLIKVAAELQNTEVLATDISGQSPFSGLVAMLVGGPSSILKAVTNLLEGDSVKSVFEGLLKGLAIDLGLGIAFTLPPGVLDDLVKIFAQKAVEEKLKSLPSKYTATLQAKLQGDLARILQLDANGERHLTIRKDFYDLLVRLGKGADIYLPTKPAGYCASNADCDDGNWCNGAERCVNEKCVAGTKPCLARERCNSRAQTCIENCGGNGKMCPKDYVAIR